MSILSSPRALAAIEFSRSIVYHFIKIGAFLFFNFLAGVGLSLLFFFFLGGLSIDGMLVHLNNFAERFVDADTFRQQNFRVTIVTVWSFLTLLVCLLRYSIFINIFQRIKV
jgi:hypothetical protein